MKGVFIMEKLLKIKELKNKLNLGKIGEQITQYCGGYIDNTILWRLHW